MKRKLWKRVWVSSVDNRITAHPEGTENGKRQWTEIDDLIVAKVEGPEKAERVCKRTDVDDLVIGQIESLEKWKRD